MATFLKITVTQPVQYLSFNIKNFKYICMLILKDHCNIQIVFISIYHFTVRYHVCSHGISVQFNTCCESLMVARKSI